MRDLWGQGASNRDTLISCVLVLALFLGALTLAGWWPF